MSETMKVTVFQYAKQCKILINIMVLREISSCMYKSLRKNIVHSIEANLRFLFPDVKLNYPKLRH